MGARPVAVMDSLRFGPIVAPTAADQSVRPTQANSAQAEIHKNHSLLEGVVRLLGRYARLHYQVLKPADRGG